MLGDELLVAPVDRARPAPDQAGVVSAGQWVDVFTGEVHAGGPQRDALRCRWTGCPCSRARGRSSPAEPGPKVADVRRRSAGHRRLRRGRRGYSLYEDAGVGFGYRRGRVRRTPLRWDQAGGDDDDRACARALPAGMRPKACATSCGSWAWTARATSPVTTGGKTRELHGWSYDPATGRLEAAVAGSSRQRPAGVRQRPP